jgi:hypothetical protein
VAGSGEVAMKPSLEDETVAAGGPWEECFEAAVQLALRAGQVSALAAGRWARALQKGWRAGRVTPTRNSASRRMPCARAREFSVGAGRAGAWHPHTEVRGRHAVKEVLCVFPGRTFLVPFPSSPRGRAPR